MASRRPTLVALHTEEELAARAASAGQGNRRRPREHGDLAMYQWGILGKDRANGCRCEVCVEANRAYKRRYARERLARHGGGFVAMHTVRPHVRRLVQLGWQIKQIADAAGMIPNAVARIYQHGDPNGDVQRRSAAALLAIPAVPRHRLDRFHADQAMRDRAEAITAGRWTPDRDDGRYQDGDAWKAYAGCAGLDAESMLPGRGDSLDACRALCGVCPVQADCAEAGLREKFGVWGGLSERERRRIRRERGIVLDDDIVLEVVA